MLVQGNFGLKLQNGLKLPYIHARYTRYIVMQITKVNREKAY